jgi:hypothetical protein
MAKKQNLSQQEKKGKNLKYDYIDPCPACGENLYYDEHYTKRVALLDKGDITAWQCPFCSCQFDLKDNFTYINMSDNRAGKA